MQEASWGVKMQKKWFNGQLEYWGRNGNKVFNPFLRSIPIEVQEFKRNFENMIKRYIYD